MSSDLLATHFALTFTDPFLLEPAFPRQTLNPIAARIEVSTCAGRGARCWA
jgi:hypothetical protein